MALQTSKTTAMLFALTSRHPSIPLNDFNRWYDERHAPSRAVCPGVHGVSRFRLVDEVQGAQRLGNWTWLAMYELKSEDALQTDEYKSARKQDGDDESRQFDFLSRRVYILLDDNQRDDYAAFATSGKSRFLSMTGLEPQDSIGASPAEAVEQYKDKHTAAVASKNGWLRSSYWELSTAADPRTWEEEVDVPKVLVLHEWENSGTVRGTYTVQAAVGVSDQTDANADLRIGERALLELWRQF